MIYFSWFACFLKELKTAEQQINVLNVKLFSVFLFQLFFCDVSWIYWTSERGNRTREEEGRTTSRSQVGLKPPGLCSEDTEEPVRFCSTSNRSFKIRTGLKVMTCSQTLHFWSKLNVIFRGLWYFPTLLTVSERSTFYYYHL